MSRFLYVNHDGLDVNLDYDARDEERWQGAEWRRTHCPNCERKYDADFRSSTGCLYHLCLFCEYKKVARPKRARGTFLVANKLGEYYGTAGWGNLLPSATLFSGRDVMIHRNRFNSVRPKSNPYLLRSTIYNLWNDDGWYVDREGKGWLRPPEDALNWFPPAEDVLSFEDPERAVEASFWRYESAFALEAPSCLFAATN